MGSEYFEVEITLFKRTAKTLPFDVYLKLSDSTRVSKNSPPEVSDGPSVSNTPGEKYVHVFSKTTGVDYSRLSKYIEKGITRVYIRKKDAQEFKQYAENLPEKLLKGVANNALSPSERATLLANIAEQNIHEIFATLHGPNAQNEQSDAAKVEVVERAIQTMNHFIKTLSEDPKSLSAVLRLLVHSEYLFFHAVAVSVVSMFLAKASGIAGEPLLRVIGLGGLFHDIGITTLAADIDYLSEELTPAQWREVRMHPSVGVRLIEGCTNLPDEVRYIIEQHHEEPSGAGYPVGLRGPVIFHPAKVVAVADAFCALISKRGGRQALSVDEALVFLKQQVGRYDPTLVNTLVRLYSRAPATPASERKAA